MRAKTTSLVRTASRSVAARRQFSSEPKMHKAKDHWADLKAKRPVDHDDLHVRTACRQKSANFEIPNSLIFFPFRLVYTLVDFPSSLQQGYHHDYPNWCNCCWMGLHGVWPRPPAVQARLLEVNTLRLKSAHRHCVRRFLAELQLTNT